MNAFRASFDVWLATGEGQMCLRPTVGDPLPVMSDDPSRDRLECAFMAGSRATEKICGAAVEKLQTDLRIANDLIPRQAELLISAHSDVQKLRADLRTAAERIAAQSELLTRACQVELSKGRDAATRKLQFAVSFELTDQQAAFLRGEKEGVRRWFADSVLREIAKFHFEVK